MWSACTSAVIVVDASANHRDRGTEFPEPGSRTDSGADRGVHGARLDRGGPGRSQTDPPTGSKPAVVRPTRADPETFFIVRAGDVGAHRKND